MKKISKFIEIMKEVMKKYEEEEMRKREKERGEWLEEIGYRTKDGDYFSDIIRRRVKPDVGYAIVNNILIEQKENLTEEEAEHYNGQKEAIEKLLAYYYMQDHGWTNIGTYVYRKEEYVE